VNVTVEKSALEILRARLFPTIDDIDPNYYYYGLDKVPVRPETRGAPVDDIDQWTGRFVADVRFEEAEKRRAYREAEAKAPLCPSCGAYMHQIDAGQWHCTKGMCPGYMRGLLPSVQTAGCY